MDDKTLYQTILGLMPPLTVTEAEFKPTEETVAVTVSSNQRRRHNDGKDLDFERALHSSLGIPGVDLGTASSKALIQLDNLIPPRVDQENGPEDETPPRKNCERHLPWIRKCSNRICSTQVEEDVN